jgi:hypothetical protein
VAAQLAAYQEGLRSFKLVKISSKLDIFSASSNSDRGALVVGEFLRGRWKIGRWGPELSEETVRGPNFAS